MSIIFETACYAAHEIGDYIKYMSPKCSLNTNHNIYVHDHGVTIYEHVIISKCKLISLYSPMLYFIDNKGEVMEF